MRVLAALGATATALVNACTDPVAARTPPANPSSLATSATGAPTLTWLAPLGTGTADAAAFDAAAAPPAAPRRGGGGAPPPPAAPQVEVCAWTGTACAAAPVARFSTAPAAGELPLTVNAAAGRYEATWSLMNASFTTRTTYRIRVVQGTAELGAVFVDAVRGRWALTRSDGTVAPLVSAPALPIWFSVSRPSSGPPNLTVVLGPGVHGTPAAGATSYPAGTRVAYTLATLPGYRHLRVQLDGADADTAGAITIAAAHTLFATADRIPVVSDQALPVVPLARALVTATDAAGAQHAADAFTTAARTLYETLGPDEARRQLAEISALTFDPVRDSTALRRTTEWLAEAGSVSYRVTAGGAAANRAALRAGRAASLAGAAATARPTTVMFVNGVLNSPTSGMQGLVEVDRVALEAGLLAQSGGDLKMQLFYNASWLGDPKAGPFNCLMGVGVDELSGQLTRKLEGEKCSGGLLGPLEVATQYAAGLLATSRLSVPQARLLADRLRAELDAGRKVLVVAHSQGNLMAQQATRLLEETLPPAAMRCLAVTSVAPPVTTNWPQVVWTGVYAKGTRTRDILLDVLLPTPVTTMVRSNVTDAADARVNATPLGFQTLWSFFEDAKLHAMVGSYMAGDNTRLRIRDDLAQSAQTLEAQCRDTQRDTAWLTVSPRTVQAGNPVTLTFTLRAEATAPLVLGDPEIAVGPLFYHRSNNHHLPCRMPPVLPGAKSYSGSCSATVLFLEPRGLGAWDPGDQRSYTQNYVHYLYVARPNLNLEFLGYNEASLTVTPAPAPTVSVTVSPTTVRAGSRTTLTFTVNVAGSTPLFSVGNERCEPLPRFSVPGLSGSVWMGSDHRVWFTAPKSYSGSCTYDYDLTWIPRTTSRTETFSASAWALGAPSAYGVARVTIVPAP